MLLDYFTFEFVEEGFFRETDYLCDRCDTSLLLDEQRQILHCSVCGSEYKEPAN